MAGTKRSREGQPLVTTTTNNNNNQPTPDASQPAMAVAADVAMSDAPAAAAAEPVEETGVGVDDTQQRQMQLIFENFRDELDEHYDRRERVVKATRDITALSKKIIFSLQRVRAVAAPIPPSIAKENKTRIDQILELFRALIPDIDATGPHSWRYQRQLSGGVQEFVEALSFQHYVQTQRLITIEEVRAVLPRGILVTEEDYLLGLFDLTGEMMRFAVTLLSTGGQVKKPGATGASTKPIEKITHLAAAEEEEAEAAAQSEVPELSPAHAGIVVDLRAMRSEFETLNVPRRHAAFMIKDLPKKMEVMQQSVEKVERAAYGILVRGSERPGGWTPDLTGPAEVETY
ncbi:hypothetical protein VTN02DRAFT_1790 [Thermoascus thermophilus]